MENTNKGGDQNATESIGVTEMLTKEKGGWIGTEDDKYVFRVPMNPSTHPLVDIAVKHLYKDDHKIVSVPRDIILELAEKIKQEENN